MLDYNLTQEVKRLLNIWHIAEILLELANQEQSDRIEQELFERSIQ
jgi:hypothetical protein